MTAGQDRQLLLWRHAHAPWSEPDFDRDLSELGQKQARLQAERLDAVMVDTGADWTVICSPARRTASTLAALLKRSARLKASLSQEEAVYNASTGDLHALIAQQRGNVLLVGHNPGLSQLATWLTGHQPRINLAPSACVHLTVPVSLDPATGTLMKYLEVPAQVE